LTNKWHKKGEISNQRPVLYLKKLEEEEEEKKKEEEEKKLNP
jgi:hypothetical protein